MAATDMYTNTNQTCLDSFRSELLEALKPFMKSSTWSQPEPSYPDLFWSIPCSEHIDTAFIGLNSSEIGAQVDEYWFGPFNSKELAQLDASFGQPTPQLPLEVADEIDSQPNVDIARSGIRQLHTGIDLHKNNAIERIEKDYGITRQILEQHFGMTLEDAAKALHVSRSTLKRIRKEYGISRWPHYKTRKVCHHVSQDISLQGMGDQRHSDLSLEKGADHLVYKTSCPTSEPYDSVMMTVEVTCGSDIIKFDLSPSLTRVELEGEVEKRINIPLQIFSIKYLDTDDDWILIESDSDLRDGMHSLRLSGRTTMKLLVTLNSDNS